MCWGCFLMKYGTLVQSCNLNDIRNLWTLPQCILLSKPWHQGQSPRTITLNTEGINEGLREHWEATVKRTAPLIYSITMQYARQGKHATVKQQRKENNLPWMEYMEAVLTECIHDGIRNSKLITNMKKKENEEWRITSQSAEEVNSKRTARMQLAQIHFEMRRYICEPLRHDVRKNSQVSWKIRSCCDILHGCCAHSMGWGISEMDTASLQNMDHRRMPATTGYSLLFGSR